MDDIFSSSFNDDLFNTVSIFDLGIDHSIGCNEINPASGLPMIGDGIGGVDVCGTPYGFSDGQ
jgi:hypothetical protein